MKDVILKRVVAISLLVGAACCHAAGQYEDRWFYVSRNRTPGCTGIMYTTWRDKYKLLAQFGELVRKESAPSVKVQ